MSLERRHSSERRLAAIFSADVQGYSRLMAHDEEATIRTLAEYRKRVTALVEEHRGRNVFPHEDPSVIERSVTALRKAGLE